MRKRGRRLGTLGGRLIGSSVQRTISLRKSVGLGITSRFFSRDEESRDFTDKLAKLSSPRDIVQAFIDDNWDHEAFVKTVRHGQKTGLVTTSEARALLGEGSVRADRFDT